jgi:TolC family type I secretion outer membrane protein
VGFVTIAGAEAKLALLRNESFCARFVNLRRLRVIHSFSSWRSAMAASLMAVALAAPAPAFSETLFDALTATYTSNPTIRADRARQRGTDEGVSQALSGWRPSVTASGQAGVEKSDSTASSPTESDPASVSIQLSQPIFRGFQTLNRTALAKANVLAGRANLSSTEQSVLLQAVAAYMNVVRDRRIVDLRQQDVKVLGEQLNAANARFNVGEITRTDVAQARAGLSLAKSNLALAVAQRASSIANYEMIVGKAPGSLKSPGLPKILPSSLEAALAKAETTNPEVIAAMFAEEAARHQVDYTRGDLLPRANLVAEYATQNDASGVNGLRATSQQVYGSVSMPLYEAGQVYAGVREAKQMASQRRIQVIERQRGVRQAVVSSWNNLVASGQSIVASAEQVKASQLALDGVRQEAMVGSRTTLDVLNAQQDLVNAEVRLVQAERDQIVGAYQVLATTGQLTPAEIGLGIENYDPAENYKNVRFKFIGTGIDEVE